MSFAFKPDEEWQPKGGILSKGDYICAIVDIDAEEPSSGGFPKVEVKTACEEGEITNWIVISNEKTFGKFTNLVLSAGIPEANWPQPGRDFDPNTGKVSQEYCDRYLYNRKVGVIVRDEPDNRQVINGQPNPYYGQMRSAVKGYVKVEEIRNPGPLGAATPAAGAAASATTAAAAGNAQRPAGEPLIPF